MTMAITTPGISGFAIEPQWAVDGSTLWHWRAWHNDALEGNAAESYEAASDAVRGAHDRLTASKEPA